MHLMKTLLGTATTVYLRHSFRLTERLATAGRDRRITTGPDGVVKSPYGVMEFPKCQLHECIYEKMSPFDRRVALECTVTGRKYTYKKLRQAANALAASFQNKLKLSTGDVVAAFLPNLPEYPMIFLASSQCGAITSTVNSAYKHEEVARQIEASNAKAIITTLGLYSIVTGALHFIKKSIPVIVIKETERQSIPEGAINFFELIDPSTCGDFKNPTSSNDDVIILPFSSGTTGLPKGVELMHRNIVSNVHQLLHARENFGIESLPHDIVLGLLPMFHIYGMTAVTLTPLAFGATILTVPKFEPVAFLDVIVTRKVTTLYLVPPLILFLGSNSVVKPKYLKSVHLVINGASPIGHNDLEKLQAKGQHMVIGQGYGMTETSPVVLIFNKKSILKRGGTGVPIVSTEVKVVDPETQKPLSANSPGELWVKGPQVMKGYLNNPKATEDIFSDAWLKTGDIVYYDEDGVFFIADRLKDLIKVKGFQVAPAELEELLRTHPKIIDAAVIGIPDSRKGEVAKAFVVVREGEKVTEDEVKEYVKKRVAEYKQLEGGVVFLKEIPKNAAGKIIKKDLRKM